MTVSRDTTIVLGLSLGALILIIIGFVLGGSPWEARALRRDEQRTQLLQHVQNQVFQQYRETSILLTQEAYATRSWADPFYHRSISLYGAPEYRVVGDRSFELCSTFERSRGTNFPSREFVPFTESVTRDQESVIRSASYVDFQQHPVGRACWTIEAIRVDPTQGTTLFDLKNPSI